LAENKTETRALEKKQLSIPPMAIVIVAAVAIGLAGFWYLNRPVAPKAPPPLTGDARAYVHNLALSGVGMQANESYLSQQVVEITGQLGNRGDRVLRTVELNCVFYDPYGQVVLRERVPIISAKMGGLAPGESKPFRLAFDDVPETWNQAMPQLVIAGIDFS
jgi:hypothetical protein